MIAIKDGLIPDKRYFKMSEVCRITGIQSHTLRFWEAELRVIKPRRASGNQRLYRREDIEKILEIKYLLKEKGHTLAGAKKYLKQRGETKVPLRQVKQNTETNLLHKIKFALGELQKILEK